jgi:hypothetical protein
MTTPVGNLVGISNQTKSQVVRTFILWALATTIIFVLIFGLVTVNSEDSKTDIAYCYSIVLLPAIGMVLAALNLFRQNKKLEIYTDGFVLRNAQSDSIIESAFWQEVRDITWSEDRQKATNRRAGFALGWVAFGVLGALITANAAEAMWDNEKRDLYILLPRTKKKNHYRYWLYRSTKTISTIGNRITRCVVG